MCRADRRALKQICRGRPLVLVTIIFTVCLTNSCASFFQNQRLESFSSEQGYRYKNITPGKHNSDSLFLILTFSGGGTRAAAFSYGVLEKLRDTEIVWEGERRRLLDEVDVISSVSGGSLTAGYYGLFGDRIFEDFTDRVLYRNIQGWLLAGTFSLRKVIKRLSPYYGRTDVMAEGFNKFIFERKTYSDLLARNQRPYIVINATDMFRGRRFVFTQDQFDLLYSDLSSYPVGYAVAASAAFPGAFTPLTIENHKKGQDFELPGGDPRRLALQPRGSEAFEFAEQAQSYLEPGRPYIHLIDGGVSDNIGLLPVVRILRMMSLDEAARATIRAERIQKVAIITVNAKSGTKTKWDRKKKVPNAILTTAAAATTPMNSLSQLEINYVRLFIEKAMAEQQRSDYRFIEVAFDWMGDPEEKAYLKAIPTSFTLPNEDVDKLRKAASEVLDNHPDYQALLKGLR